MYHMIPDLRDRFAERGATAMHAASKYCCTPKYDTLTQNPKIKHPSSIERNMHHSIYSVYILCRLNLCLYTAVSTEPHVRSNVRSSNELADERPAARETTERHLKLEIGFFVTFTCCCCLVPVQQYNSLSLLRTHYSLSGVFQTQTRVSLCFTCWYGAWPSILRKRQFHTEFTRRGRDGHQLWILKYIIIKYGVFTDSARYMIIVMTN